MKKTLLLLLLGCLCGTLTLVGQTTMNIIELDETLTSSKLSDIGAITFSNRIMTLTKTDNEELIFKLSDLRSIVFDIDSRILAHNYSELEATIFPNPSHVNQMLTLSVESKSEMPLTINIYSLNGVKMESFTLPFTSSQRINFTIKNASSGIYLAIIRQADFIKVEKLIIQ